MHAGFFDMLHNARHMHGSAVTKRVYITFNSTRQITVKQDRAIARDHNRLFDIAFQLSHIAHDFHRPAAQHVRRTDHQRKPEPLGNFNRLFIRAGNAVLGLL